MQNVMCSLPDAVIASFGEFAIEIEYFEITLWVTNIHIWTKLNFSLVNWSIRLSSLQSINGLVVDYMQMFVRKNNNLSSMLANVSKNT